MAYILKNFTGTLRRFKAASALNIIGLTFAFAAFYVVLSQVLYNVTFNRSIKDSERIYIECPLWDDGQWCMTGPAPITRKTAEMMPDVEAYGHILTYGLTKEVWKKSPDGTFNKYDYWLNMITPSVVDILSMECVEGDLSKIAEPNHVIISRSVAEGMGVHAGETIYLSSVLYGAKTQPDWPVVVAGVFEDFAKNSMFSPNQYQIIIKMHDFYITESVGNWNTMNCVKFKEGADIEKYIDLWCENYLEAEKNQYADAWEKYKDDCMILTEEEPLKMIPANKMFFDKSLWGGAIEQGTVEQTIILIGIALLIVIIAFINFVNFFYALIPTRIKSVNISKVFGASQLSLRLSFIAEALCLVVVSFVATLLIVPLADDMVLHNLLTAPLAIEDNALTVLVMLAILIVMAFTAALYPAIYVTSVNASLGVKEGFATSVAGRRLRSVLVGFQFTVAIILMILASVFTLQYKHVREFDLGFDKEHIVYFVGSNSLASHADSFVEYLEGNSDIDGVTQSNEVLIGANQTWSNTYKGQEISVQTNAVRHNFFDVLGVDIIEGRNLKPWQEEGESQLIVNQYIWDKADMEVDTKFAGSNIIGVVKDIKTYSLEQEIKGVGWYVANPIQLRRFYVRMRAGADFEKVRDDINAAVQRFVPGDDVVDVYFLDQQVEQLYGSTKKQATVITLFAVIAIVISLMGVFGILLFDTQYRKKEIALRKVSGATNMEIIAMLNKSYIRTLLVCFTIAVPVTYAICTRWLEQFANRISLHWWLYAVVLLALLVITSLLVTLRSYRAATENPVDSLKSE